MPIGVRDFLLVLRAQDQASRVLAQVGKNMGMVGQAGKLSGAQVSAAGQSLVEVGAAIGAVGAAGLAFFGYAANAAKKYNQEASLTLTQIDDTSVKLEDIKRIGIEVARAVPAPFKEMQKSLFDIFSSMDVNTKQAQGLLTSFSKGAVAGQTDIQDAARASISIMNAFKIPAEQVSHVMDVQFQVVRKGVINYQEFASTIGRAIPSAVKAGASVEELGGMIAFLTRNGQSAAMASTSAARAFDLLSNPKFAKNMKDFGISVLDAKGNFRPMLDVTTELRKKLQGLNEGDRAKVLKDLTFGAGGTIQAMRFLNLAVQDNGNLLGEMTDAMHKSGGEAQKAYKIMSETPQAKIDALRNKFDTLMVTIGDKVLPHVGKLAEFFGKIIDKFTGLSDAMQDNIVKWGLFGSVALVAIGAAVALLGAFAIIAGSIMTAFGVGLAGAIGIMAAIPAAIALVVAGIYLLIKHFGGLKEATGQFMEVFGPVGDYIVAAFERAQTYLYLLNEAWQSILHGEFIIALLELASYVDQVLGTNGQITATLGTFIGWVKGAWEGLKTSTIEFWHSIMDAVMELGQRIADFAMQVFGSFQQWWDDNGANFVKKVVDIWNAIYTNVAEILGMLSEAVSHILNVLMYIIGGILSVLGYMWREWGDNLLRIATNVWNTILEVIRGLINTIMGIIKFVLAVINGDWSKAWDALKQTVDGAWDAIFGLLRGAVKLVGELMGLILEALASPLRNLWDMFFGFGKNLVQGLIDGVKSMIGKVGEEITKLTKAISSPMGMFKFGSPSRWAIQRGKWLGEGLAGGISSTARMVEDAAAYLARAAAPDFGSSAFGGASTGAGSPGFGAQLASTGSNVSLTLESGAIVITGVTDAQGAADAIDVKLRALVDELRVRN